MHTHTSSSPARRLTIATRVGSLSALKRSARAARAPLDKGGAPGEQQTTGSFFIDNHQYSNYAPSSTAIDERRIMNTFHLSLDVPDLEAAVAFYRELFGME